MPSDRPATIYDVAEHAKVSISTVSLALNHPGRLKRDTLDRVLAAADHLDFVPKARAMVQARQQLTRVAAVAPFTSYPSFSRRLAGVMDELGDSGVELVVCDCADIAVSTSPVLASIPVRGYLDGLLNLGVPMDDAIANRLQRRSLPTVLLDVRFPGMPDISVDDHEGGRLLGAHLAGLGHTRVAFLNEVETYAFQSPPVLRLAGLRAALGARAVTEITVPRGTQAGAEAITKLLDNSALAKAVTAVVGARDLVAVGALAELRKRGIDVPTRMSVAGFDDDPVAEALGLTTIRHPFEESGRLAVRALRNLVNHPDAPTTSTTLAVELKPRATTARAATELEPAPVSTS